MKSEKTSDLRKLSIQGFKLVEGSHNFLGLLEFDVTHLRKRLRDLRHQNQGGSLLAFFLKAIARTMTDLPLFNSFVSYRKISTFHTVDINIPVEVRLGSGVENRQLIIRDVANKSLKTITDEIAAVKESTQSNSWFTRPGLARKLICLMPAFVFQWITRCVMKSHRLVQNFSGTVFVTSLSSVSSVPGYIIPYTGGPQAVSIALGSVYKKPVVVSNQIEIREVISITAAFNHDLVDGAPAARFINQFRRYIERDWDAVMESDLVSRARGSRHSDKGKARE